MWAALFCWVVWRERMRYKGGGKGVLFAGVVRFVSSSVYRSGCRVGVGYCVVGGGKLGCV